MKKTSSMKARFFRQSLFMNCLLLLIPILILGPYSILKSSSDNTKAILKSMTQTLNQCDNMIDSFYAHIDNANIFFSSNPRVTVQLEQAFKEQSLSLNSLKNVEHLSLYFQNLIFTNSYINDIYVYYDNDNHRLYMPQKGAIQTYPDLYQSSLIQFYQQENGSDFQIEIRQPQIGALTSRAPDSLFFYQKLYGRSTHRPAGVFAFEFNLNRLKQYFDTLKQYNSQVIYLVDAEQNLIYTNSTSAASTDELAVLLSSTEYKKTQSLCDVEINGIHCKSTFLKSSRPNGLTYFTYTPSSEIYKTTRSMSETYAILTLCAVGISFALAFYKSNKEYQYLNNILDIFSNPAASQKHFKHVPKSASNPFEHIMFNIIRLFVQQDYLKVQASQKEYKIQMLKLQALQHQINPHFLHNTLNSIYWESVRLTGAENACSSMVSSLSFVMRYSLSDPQEDVKAGEEIKYLKKYLDIMKIRYPDKFHVEYRIDPSCDIYPLKKMILQPLAENSIYHGLKEKEEKGKICVGLKPLRNSTVFYIYDNGRGISPPVLAQISKQLLSTEETTEQHIGLINTNLRLKLAYGETSRIHMKSMEGTYTLVYFFINYLKECAAKDNSDETSNDDSNPLEASSGYERT